MALLRELTENTSGYGSGLFDPTAWQRGKGAPSSEKGCPIISKRVPHHLKKGAPSSQKGCPIISKRVPHHLKKGAPSSQKTDPHRPDLNGLYMEYEMIALTIIVDTRQTICATLTKYPLEAGQEKDGLKTVRMCKKNLNLIPVC